MSGSEKPSISQRVSAALPAARSTKAKRSSSVHRAQDKHDGRALKHESHERIREAQHQPASERGLARSEKHQSQEELVAAVALVHQLQLSSAIFPFLTLEGISTGYSPLKHARQNDSLLVPVASTIASSDRYASESAPM